MGGDAGTAGFAFGRTICMVTQHLRPEVSYKILIRLSLVICIGGTKLAIRISDNPQSLTQRFPD
jgi:hypothetical protein